MSVAIALGGIWSAALTPVDSDFQPDAAKAIPYFAELLRDGCNGLNILGTTGEAMSLSAAQRLTFMERIARSELPSSRVMAGTGASSLEDAVRLTRAAFDFGFAAALIMPPFFYRDAGDNGIVRFFDALLARAHSAGKRIVLYNFPKMSGVTFHPVLLDRLLAEFPEAIAGMKDSSNDRAFQADALARHPDLRVFPGSEGYLREAKACGAAGCISGSVCLWPSLAREVFDTDDEAQAQELTQRRQALEGGSMIATVRAAVAAARNDADWLRSLPPL